MIAFARTHDTDADNITTQPAHDNDSGAACYDDFVAMLPTIARCARTAFSHLNPEARAEAVQEVIANTFLAYVRLVEQGKHDQIYSTALARYAILQVRVGREVGTSMNRNDALSRYAQQQRGFCVVRFEDHDRDTGAWREAVVEDYRTPPSDQAAFRIDFPGWLDGQSRRNQRIAIALAVGERTMDVAKKFGMSKARVSQLRREFAESWAEFHGEVAVAGA